MMLGPGVRFSLCSVYNDQLRRDKCGLNYGIRKLSKPHRTAAREA